MNKRISLIIKEVCEARTDQEKISILRKFSSTPLRGYLTLAISKERKLLLPEGTPPFRATRNQGRSNLNSVFYNFYRKIYIFQNPDLAAATRQRLFVEMLEQIDPEDARFLIDVVKDQKLPAGLTEDVIRQAFPEI